MQKRNKFHTAIDLAVAALAFGGLISMIDWRRFHEVILKVDWRCAALGFLLFAAADVWRAIRYRILLEFPTLQLLPIVVAHQTAVTILPFRLGELSFFYFLRRRGTSLRQGLAALAVVRLADLIIVAGAAIILGIVGFGGRYALHLYHGVAYWVPLAVFFVFLLKIVAGILRRGLWNKLSSKPRALSFLITLIEDVARDFGKYFAKNNKIYIIIAVSLLIWINNVLVSTMLLRSVGVSLGLVQVGLIASTLQLVSAVPLSFAGGLGTSDLSLAVLLMLYSVSPSEAASAAVATRLIFYAYLLAWGGAGWIGWGYWGGRARGGGNTSQVVFAQPLRGAGYPHRGIDTVPDQDV
ncbi:lysylphosphatidylglycerol synthase transmembrane domain-containing protein [Thermoflexus sp.]|uniref:lysylphosphatidylglycerol synthase transmembrane domain-containing protein n=1 Tax=Thermoflexus sp. TaxID=1969742 RepID=UPI002ADE511F|nr:lysylphosphatidylglycerol synthase transmembrane domain-containing protein [Thermoflexus sp.]